jgi:CheY-like chemotaxis protein
MRKDAYSVEVIGFNQTERIVLSSIFGLSARRTPKFTQHSTVAYSPDLFLVDAADAQAVALFKERNSSGKVSAIMIGETDHGTGWPVLGRPLQWTRLFKAFDLSIADSHKSNEPANVTPPFVQSGSLTPAMAPVIQTTLVPPAPPSPVPLSSRAYAPTEPMYSIPPMINTQPISLVPSAPSKPEVPVPASVPLPTATPAPAPVIATRITPPQTTQPQPQISRGMSPAAQTPPPLVSQPPVITTVTPPKPANNADWVLVVDDNLTVREFMRSKLAPFNFNVDYAESGEQAVGLTGSRHYTCVFLDVIMPGIDGYQVCKLIKSKKSVHKTAVVMLTSKGSPFDKIRGAMAGCDAYLTKPVDEDKLLGTIVKFLPMHA